MRAAYRTLAGLVTCAAIALAGCSTEQVSLDLEVGAAPNPVAGVADGGGRRWDYRISIGNPNPVGVSVAYYHAEISGTDTGYEQPLQIVEESQVIGRRIAPGATATYAANRSSGGNFSRGRERRIYHALGDDGKYYSGEVVIELR
jgi:hypothetical protein